jgi:hypothetical protein
LKKVVMCLEKDCKPGWKNWKTSFQVCRYCGRTVLFTFVCSY